MIRPGPLAAVIALVCLALAAVTPPFQAPDEGRHTMRGYQVAHGTMMPERVTHDRRGGHIDAGLVALIDIWRPLAGDPTLRVSGDRWDASRSVDWTGTELPASFGTQESGPLIYLPIALGFAAGEPLGLSPISAYFLSRALVITLNCAVLWCAFRTCRPTPIVTAILILPMSAFLMSNAVIDGISISCAALACASFVRCTRDRTRTAHWVLPTMAAAIVVSVSGRPHGAPLLALMPLSFIYTRRVSALWMGAALPCAVFGWLAAALSDGTSLGDSPPAARRTVHAIAADVTNVMPTITSAVDTVTSWKWIVGQYKMWVGDLGSLDTPLGTVAYITIGILLLMALACAVQWRPLRKTPPPAVALLVCGAASAALVVLALKLFYNPPTSGLIYGIQGRYFLVPALILAYSTVAGPTDRLRWQVRGARALVWAVLAVSLVAAMNALLRRYYGIGIG